MVRPQLWRTTSAIDGPRENWAESSKKLQAMARRGKAAGLQRQNQPCAKSDSTVWANAAVDSSMSWVVWADESTPPVVLMLSTP